MEIVGSFLDEEWESLSQMFSENPHDFLLHCDGFSSNLQIPFSPSHPNISQESISEALFLNINTFESINNINIDGRFMLPPVFPDHVMEHDQFLRLKPENRASDHEFMLKRNSEEAPFLHTQDHEDNFSPPNKKKPRNAYKSKKKTKKTIQEKVNINEEQGINGGGGNRVSCSSYSSDDESNAKTRATRGSATDPQSLYARKRRERINERLKILQNLVPNGTKVDISTMLEEAVHYVKFLQLQIKLLSSDNLWMYAPLAYNGMDIGIIQNISPDLRP